MKTERRLITQPGPWWTAFKKQAEREEARSFSEWVGDCLLAQLDPDLIPSCLDRPVGRPKKEKTSCKPQKQKL